MSSPLSKDSPFRKGKTCLSETVHGFIQKHEDVIQLMFKQYQARQKYMEQFKNLKIDYIQTPADDGYWMYGVEFHDLSDDDLKIIIEKFNDVVEHPEQSEIKTVISVPMILEFKDGTKSHGTFYPLGPIESNPFGPFDITKPVIITNVEKAIADI
jgi:hypothetical protein